MSLVKTAELDPSKSYVFGFHPHGIISMSAFIAFATEGLNVSKVFPGEQAPEQNGRTHSMPLIVQKPS